MLASFGLPDPRGDVVLWRQARRDPTGLSPDPAVTPELGIHLPSNAVEGLYLRRQGGVAKRQHQPIGPVEECRCMDDIGDCQIIETSPTQLLHML